MGIVFRQSIKTTIVTFIGALLGAIISYAYTYILTKTELGFTRNLITQGSVLQYFIVCGSGLMLGTFIQRYQQHDPRRKVLITVASLIPVITAIIITIPYLSFQHALVDKYKLQDRPFINKYYLFLPALAFLLSISTLLESFLYSQLKVAIAVFIRDVIFRVLNIGILLLFFFRIISFHYFIIISVFSYAVPFALQLLVAKKTEGFGFSTNWKIFSRNEYKEMLHFSWYHLLYAISFNVLLYIDQLMLAPLDHDGLKSLAVYTTAAFIISFMIIPYKAMSTSAYAILNKAYIDKDNENLNNLFNRSSLNMFVVATAMFLIIGCNLPNAVALLPKGYEAITPIVIILMIGRMFDMASGLNGELISMSVYYKFNFRISGILLIIVFALNRVLIPVKNALPYNAAYGIFYFHGIYGAAWSSTISLIIYNIIKYFFIWNKMNIQPLNKSTVYVIIAGTGAGIGGYLMPHITLPSHIISAVFDAIIRIIVIMILYGGLLMLLKPSEDLSDYLSFIKSNRKLF